MALPVNHSCSHAHARRRRIKKLAGRNQRYVRSRAACTLAAPRASAGRPAGRRPVSATVTERIDVGGRAGACRGRGPWRAQVSRRDGAARSRPVGRPSCRATPAAHRTAPARAHCRAVIECDGTGRAGRWSAWWWELGASARHLAPRWWPPAAVWTDTNKRVRARPTCRGGNER